MLKVVICLETSAVRGEKPLGFCTSGGKKENIIQTHDPFQHTCSACLYAGTSVSSSLICFRCPRLEGACTTSPCQHGGTCIDHWSWQQCHCKDGLTGKHCEKCMERVSRFLFNLHLTIWLN